MKNSLLTSRASFIFVFSTSQSRSSGSSYMALNSKFCRYFTEDVKVFGRYFFHALIKNPARILFSHFPPAKMDLLLA